MGRDGRGESDLLLRELSFLFTRDMVNRVVADLFGTDVVHRGRNLAGAEAIYTQ